ncbi:glycine--tRNA ligase [Candidatus Babeliales bacterium]|nr:glycine--tRNA ligase [Candidatus Babeliales bacterium]
MAASDKRSSATLDKITALCKRRGFVYQSADIYGGLNGVYDFGPLGTLLKQNIKQAWTASLFKISDAIVLLDGAILAPHAVWEASGHTESFHDPMVDCLNCKKRFRADDIDLDKACPSCGIKKWTDIRQFHMMFKTNLGALADQASVAYLRPETAQAIFINFKNVLSTSRVKVPFGIAQIGKAFRNEITPKQFLFRMREFEQMELEWFCKPSDAQKFFDFWISAREAFYQTIGIKKQNLRVRSHEKEELSHYSTNTSDIEYHFPFGWKELEGIAYRGNYDLSQHMKHSGKDLSIYDDATKESYVPHVVECSVGVDRLFLTALFDAYNEETIDGEQRIVLRLHPSLAPYKAAFFPLTKKQSEPMYTLYKNIKDAEIPVQFDDSGSIGKRYRRQDEIGTPVCFTYDFDSEIDQSVTVRHRDSMKQERIPLDKVLEYMKNLENIFTQQ